MKQHEKGAGNGNASKPAKSLTPEKPPGVDPQPENLVRTSLSETILFSFCKIADFNLHFNWILMLKKCNY